MSQARDEDSRAGGDDQKGEDIISSSPWRKSRASMSSCVDGTMSHHVARASGDKTPAAGISRPKIQEAMTQLVEDDVAKWITKAYRLASD